MDLLPDMYNCGTLMHRECRERFRRHRGLAILTWITIRAWRTFRDACRDHQPTVSFEVGGGENVPGIPAYAQPVILRIWQEARGTVMDTTALFVQPLNDTSRSQFL